MVGPSPIVMAITTADSSGRESIAYRMTLKASGGTGAIKWSVSAGALPAGLTLNSATGVISGTPAVAGNYEVSITATDAGDATNSATRPYVFWFAPAVKVASPRTMPAATAGVAYSYTMEAANAQVKTKWNLQGGALPPGMSLSPAGVVSGTCNIPGTYYFNARVKDLNTDDTLTMTLVVK